MSRAPRPVITGLILAAALLAAMTGSAFAVIHSRLLSPGKGHRVKLGSRVTFVARDTAPKDTLDYVYLSLAHTRKRDGCGRLRNPLYGLGTFHRMHLRKGSRSI